MLRIVKIILITILSIVAWAALSLYIAPRENIPDYVFNTVITLPVTVPVLFALYMLYSLIIGVKQFKTVPKEAESLQKDIARAEKELAKKGIKSN
jgi:hypothetical protein